MLFGVHFGVHMGAWDPYIKKRRKVVEHESATYGGRKNFCTGKIPKNMKNIYNKIHVEKVNKIDVYQNVLIEPK